MKQQKKLENIHKIKFVKSPKKLPGTFWAVSTFFNPLGHGNKYQHYRLFRERSQKQGLKLLMVELAFDNREFELSKEDAEIVIQIRIGSDNVLWQKEAMLNIGLKHLPEDCDKIAWIDCDILFQNDNWVKETSRLLEEYKIVQPFQFAIRMEEGMTWVDNPEKLEDGGLDEVQKIHGKIYENVRRQGLKKNATHYYGQPGFVWSARREVFKDIGLYDLIISGSGDLVMSDTFLNIKVDYSAKYSKEVARHYKKWSCEVARRVKSSVYYTPGYIFHLWHGSRKDRKYDEKDALLKNSNFNPEVDIGKNENGILIWTSEKKDLHNLMKQSFLVRKEYGFNMTKEHFVPKLTKKLPGTLWGITTFFNPAKFSTKLDNYKRFRSSSVKQGLKLLVVELAFGDSTFEIKNEEADILIQIRVDQKNILWQKEAMLNIGLKHLPEDCDKIAWIDCDILFQNDNWVKETSRLLEEYVALQLFSWQIRLEKGVYEVNVDEVPVGDGLMEKSYGLACGVANFGDQIINSPNYEEHGHTGFGWAIRREVFTKYGFYDKGIIGGGDLLMSYAFYDFKTRKTETILPTEQLLTDYNIWKENIYREVQRSVYFTSGYVLHLWHGDIKYRKYYTRHQALIKNNFDLSKDIGKNENGILIWTGYNKRLHLDLERYYGSRNEDGDLLSSIKNVTANLGLFYDDIMGFLGKKLKKISPKTYWYLRKKTAVIENEVGRFIRKMKRKKRILLIKLKWFYINNLYRPINKFIWKGYEYLHKFMGKVGNFLRLRFPKLYEKLKPYFPGRD